MLFRPVVSHHHPDLVTSGQLEPKYEIRSVKDKLTIGAEFISFNLNYLYCIFTLTGIDNADSPPGLQGRLQIIRQQL